MMQLGFVDFFAFSAVCRSWRSLALSHRNWFMASKPPMEICIKPCFYNRDVYRMYCHMNDFQGRKFKTILPRFDCRECVGVTCGYVIFFGKETRDFLLVNPITRHELHFPDHPSYVGFRKETSRSILVFSPSISAWVFVFLYRKLSFSIAGKRGWNHVSSTVPVVDLHFFKGKIYTLHKDCSLCELRLSPKQKRKSTLVETKILSNPNLFNPRLISSSENLLMMNSYPTTSEMVLELDFGEMKWVPLGKKIQEYGFFVNLLNYSFAIKPESWVGPRTQHKSYDIFFDDDKSQKCMFYEERMWYFPHDCLNVNRLDE